MTEQRPRAIVYAAKSTADPHGSIPTQLADARAMAEREGWTVEGEYRDEAFSAWSGNRGPGLAAAREQAAALARDHGTAILVAQDADRFARGSGDAPGAADHLGELFFAMKRAGVELWTVRSGHLDLLRAAIEGERSNSESERRSQSVTAGLKRRKARGEPVGALGLGWVAKVNAETGQKERVVDPTEAATAERLFGLLEAGATPGETARTLNREGLRTKRGKTFVAQTVSRLASTTAYKGDGGYPAIFDPERFDAIQAMRRRMDPVAVARRSGGRRPPGGAHFLRGIARCAVCGSTLWTRSDRGRRTYVCSHVRVGDGLCDAAPVYAPTLEKHVLAHLDALLGDLRDWLLKQTDQHEAERREQVAVIDRLRADLEALDRKRGPLMAEYERLAAEGHRLAHLALEPVEKLDQEREAKRQAIVDAKARLSEWTAPPSVDEALRLYGELVDLVNGKINAARSAGELNRALASVLAGIWVEQVDGVLRAVFRVIPGTEQFQSCPWESVLTSGFTLSGTNPAYDHRLLEAQAEGLVGIPEGSPWCRSSR
jgi:DNA invertase Pin-like site-specific DNA recombinase